MALVQVLLSDVIDRLSTDAIHDRQILVFGQPSVRLPNGQLIYECQRCGWVWTPMRDRDPPMRCSNPDKRCYNWQLGLA